MKTGRTQMSIGSTLLALAAFAVISVMRRPGGFAATVPEGAAAIGFWIGFSLPAVLGLVFLLWGIRKRKVVYAAMRDLNRPGPWDR